jgi:2-keto-4-pentenoate hydratase/2-oxohepta-3-ene-1,7-dioic acid hydratase in catechol pathway
MTIGKSFDTHGPLGPWLVTPDEVGDPQDLRVRCYVNDDLRQDASTAEMVFDCFQQVSHLSEAFTLEPGDVIATGTPAGVGLGRQPFREFLLHVGDTVRVEIERVGELVNTVIEEPDGYLAEPASA